MNRVGGRRELTRESTIDEESTAYNPYRILQRGVCSADPTLCSWAFFKTHGVSKNA